MSSLRGRLAKSDTLSLARLHAGRCLVLRPSSCTCSRSPPRWARLKVFAGLVLLCIPTGLERNAETMLRPCQSPGTPCVLGRLELGTTCVLEDADVSLVSLANVIQTGVKMELEDCALPLLAGMVCTDDVTKAFAGVHYAILVGSMPRKDGMERKDLLKANVGIFKVCVCVCVCLCVCVCVFVCVCSINCCGGGLCNSP